MIVAFQAWAKQYDTAGLLFLRVVFAGSLLWLWPIQTIEPLARLPSEFYTPPYGPFALLGGWPDAMVVTVLEAAMTATLLAVLIGLATKPASITFAVLAMTQAGLRYSTGKIDHEILFIVALPLLFGLAGWGDRFSVQSLMGRPDRSVITSATATGILALLVGVTFFMSGVAKAATGWFDPANSASYGYTVGYLIERGVVTPVNQLLVDRLPFVAWKAADYATVLLELSVLIAVLRRRWFRLLAPLMVMFHIAIWLTLGIDFIRLLIVYLPIVGTRSTEENPSNYRIPVVVAMSLVVLQGSIVWAWGEPYPAVIGPLFMGNPHNGGAVVWDRQEWTSDGEQLPVTDVFRVPQPYAENLGWALFPKPSTADHRLGQLVDLGYRFDGPTSHVSDTGPLEMRWVRVARSAVDVQETVLVVDRFDHFR